MQGQNERFSSSDPNLLLLDDDSDDEGASRPARVSRQGSRSRLCHRDVAEPAAISRPSMSHSPNMRRAVSCNVVAEQQRRGSLQQRLGMRRPSRNYSPPAPANNNYQWNSSPNSRPSSAYPMRRGSASTNRQDVIPNSGILHTNSLEEPFQRLSVDNMPRRRSLALRGSPGGLETQTDPESLEAAEDRIEVLRRRHGVRRGVSDTEPPSL